VKPFLDQFVGGASELRSELDGAAVTSDQHTDFDSDEHMGRVEGGVFPVRRVARAAGVLPRNQDGANLMIPIFRDDGTVSLVLVRVVNVVGVDGRKFPACATSNLAASGVFVSGHLLPKTPSRGTIRVVMALDTPKALSESDAASLSVFATHCDQPQTTFDANPEEEPTSTKQRHDRSGYILVDSSDPNADS